MRESVDRGQTRALVEAQVHPHIERLGDTRVASATAESKGKCMARLLLTTAIAAALIVPSVADAASTHRHKRYVPHHGRMMQNAPVGLYGGYPYGRYGNGGYGYGGYGFGGPTWNSTSGPAWAGPNQCFEDLGYGRYESCDW
jgi:hypothetical protein